MNFHQQMLESQRRYENDRFERDQRFRMEEAKRADERHRETTLTTYAVALIGVLATVIGVLLGLQLRN